MYYAFSDEQETIIYSSRPDGEVSYELSILHHDLDDVDDFSELFFQVIHSSIANLERVISFPCFHNTYFFVEPFVQKVWFVVNNPDHGEILDCIDIVWDTRKMTYNVGGKTYTLSEDLWEYIGVIDAIADSFTYNQ